MPAAIKVAITVEPELLHSVDASARRRGVSRSRFVTESLRAALRAEREADLRARIDRVLGDERAAQELLETAERFLAACAVREEVEAW